MTDVIERLCQEAEREQKEGNQRFAELLWSIAEEQEREAKEQPAALSADPEAIAAIVAQVMEKEQ